MISSAIAPIDLDALLLSHPEWSGLGRTITISEGCWEWTGFSSPKRYGRLNRNGRNQYAHRYIYQLVAGPLSPTTCACHQCDNPPCVRPSHMFLGTKAENSLDMHAKGRYRAPRVRRGIEHHLARLCDADIRQIRLLLSDGIPQREIASQFGVSQTQVSRINRGVNWCHVDK